MRILGIDPGYATIGFGLIEGERAQYRMVTYGAITTPAGLPLSKRLYQIDREKRQVMDMTKRLLKLAKTPRPDDAADALALALCHARSSTSRLPQIKPEKETV